MWTFQLSMANWKGLRAFQSFRRPRLLFVYPLFTLYGLFSISLSILHWPFKNPINKCHLGILPKSRQTKKCKKTMKSFDKVWKQSMFTTLFWLSFNTLNLPEGQETFQMIKKHQKLCRNFLENKETFRKIWKFPDILESFHTIWDLSRKPGNFPDNMESVHKIWKVYWQQWKFQDNQ